MFLAEGQRAIQQALLNLGQHPGKTCGKRIGWQELLLLRSLVAACHGGTARLEVARSDLDPDGNPLLDPLPALAPSPDVAGIDLDAHGFTSIAGATESGGDLLRLGQNGVTCIWFRRDRDDHDLGGGDTRRHDRPVVIAMRHEQRSDEPGAHTPARGPGEFLGVIARKELDAGGLGEVLP